MNAEEFFNRAAAKFEQGDIFGALSDVGEGISRNSIFAELYYELANICYRQQNWQGAIDYYTQAIRCNPDLKNAYWYRGNARFFGQGDHQGAIEDFTQIIRNNPDFADVYYYRASFRSYQGDNQGALEDFTELVRLKPSATNYYNKGVLNYLLGNYSDAIADLTESLQRDANFTPAYYARGNARYDMGEESLALADFESALRLDEQNSDIYTKDEHGVYARAIARSRQGDIPGAIADLQEAAKLSSQFRNMAFYQQVMNALKKIEQQP